MFLDLSIDLLSKGYSIRFRPAGHSMHPTIRDGEAVVVEPVEPLVVRRGDILLYRAGARIIAHRVVRIESGEGAVYVWTLRGDAVKGCDAPVSAEQILGRVVAVERGGRLRIPGSAPSALRRGAGRLKALVSRKSTALRLAAADLGSQSDFHDERCHTPAVSRDVGHFSAQAL
jgi:hypothetical protein